MIYCFAYAIWRAPGHGRQLKGLVWRMRAHPAFCTPPMSVDIRRGRVRGQASEGKSNLCVLRFGEKKSAQVGWSQCDPRLMFSKEAETKCAQSWLSYAGHVVRACVRCWLLAKQGPSGAEQRLALALSQRAQGEKRSNRDFKDIQAKLLMPL